MLALKNFTGNTYSWRRRKPIVANTQSNRPAVACPNCGTAQQWDSRNPFRPFCSEQCKNRDFIAWSNEEHSIPGQADYEDILSGDLEMAPERE
ncbi:MULTISPECIES: DNA gyrase inhibitor YacG [unclassified Spongiibacter]|nr:MULTISPECIES: DNA gyrase inhibitor YacG [Spongiibacter]MAY38434.1 DNA gyrase inhibitor YacG [Spongiibacter sp.]